MKQGEWPRAGDLVIVKIKRITNYGAGADLVEYPGKEGFIHVSQVASSWVKNIHSFVSEGQLRVAKVKKMDPRNNSLDLSLKEVSKNQEKQKNEDFKREKKADKLFEKICKDFKADFKVSYDTIVPVLDAEFGDLFSAFENASIYGAEAFNEVNIPDKWKEAIVKCGETSIKPQVVQISGIFSINSNAPDGVDVIKKSLLKAEKIAGVKLEYISAPKYKIIVSAIDYPVAEENLKKATEAVLVEVKKSKCQGAFERIKAK
ncbi:MAG: translation initiation factor IF-2 subunit alpha [Candidatus Micrarchaeota archaeon]